MSNEERLRLALCALLTLLGLSVMGGWLHGVEWLKSIAPGHPTMKFNAALAFTLAGIGLAAAPYRHLRVVGISAAWSCWRSAF